MRRDARFTVGLALLAWSGPVAAQTQSQTGPDVLVEVTEALSALYNVDNRDSRPRAVANAANDHWGLFYNRLNAQATTGRLTLTVRVDGAWFFASRTPADVASELTDRERLASGDKRDAFYRAKVTEAGIELSNRYINWVYPAKYTLLYTTRDFDVALGDSTVQLGRGLVLSVRKLDELASDTTVRGVRATGRLRIGQTRLKLTAVGGALNPLRLDEASGRYLGVSQDVTSGFLGLTEAGMPRAIETDFVPDAANCAQSGTCSYAVDRVAAAGWEAALPGVTFGTQGSILFRQDALSPDLVRSAGRIVTASQSVELPRVLDHGSVYVEAALQKLSHADAEQPDLPLGHALYLAASWAERRFSILAEGKHYRRLFPLSANVSTARAREFSLLQYNAPPTTEETWNDTEFGNFNTCVTGGRLRADAHVRPHHTVYGWIGHAVTFAESVTNLECDTDARNANRVWDAAVGVDLSPQRAKVHADASLGSRLDSAERTLAGPDGPTHAFYRELYLRYDVTGPLGGPFAFELQGFHRRRRETVGGPRDAWFEGQHSTGIEWGERVSLAFGVEYDSRPDTPNHFFNVMAAYRPMDALSLGLFAGQRRGALRCVGGVCRVYPPFEGARLDVTVRY